MREQRGEKAKGGSVEEDGEEERVRRTLTLIHCSKRSKRVKGSPSADSTSRRAAATPPPFPSAAMNNSPMHSQSQEGGGG